MTSSSIIIGITVISEKEEWEKEAENLLKEIIAEHFPIMVKRNWYLHSGRTESPPKNKPKEVHTKTCNNKNDKK